MAELVSTSRINCCSSSCNDGEFAIKRFRIRKSLSVPSDLARSEGTLRDFRIRNRLIANSPSLQLEEQQLMRDVETNSAIYIELERQQEIAKIDEVKNIPAVQVLDHASPPVRKSYPPRTAIVLGTMILACLAVGAAVLIRQADSLPPPPIRTP